jgi:hypothetical protein
MKTLTVTKGDYTRSYDITMQFTDPVSQIQYAAIVDDAFAQLDSNIFNQRLEGFINYVCSLEQGLSQDCPDIARGSVVWDPDACPITLQAPGDISDEQTEE